MPLRHVEALFAPSHSHLSIIAQTLRKCQIVFSIIMRQICAILSEPHLRCLQQVRIFFSVRRHEEHPALQILHKIPRTARAVFLIQTRKGSSKISRSASESSARSNATRLRIPPLRFLTGLVRHSSGRILAACSWTYSVSCFPVRPSGP